MGKIKVATLGSDDEQKLRDKKAVQNKQKKMREGKTRVVDTAAESLIEFEKIQEILQKASEPVQESVKSAKIIKVKIRSKRYQEFKKLVLAEVCHTISEGILLLRKVSLTKFDASVELHITLKDKGFTKELDLPHPFGKAKRAVEASDEVITAIETGKFDFDVLVATPAQMAKLVKFAKVLGPKGLMPNPKNGTVTTDIKSAIKKFSSNQTLKLRSEKDSPAVHTTIGKLSMTDTQLDQNISAVIAVLPAGRVAKIILKSTMSPAIKLAF